MRHHASLLFQLPEPTARAIALALSPEAAAAEVPKTRGAIAHDDHGVRIELDAADLASLRATVNSHLRWVDAAERATRLAK